MINNYQQDAGEEDDRDSGSLSILSPLSKGDQVRAQFHLQNTFTINTFAINTFAIITFAIIYLP